MKIFESRRYQERAVEQFKDWYFNSYEKLATIILPTGAGKSFCTALCINELTGKKVLWTSHREELSDQGYETLKSVIKDGRKISLEIGDKKGDPNADIVVGSVQTISRARKHFEGFVPDLIFIDEYHHYSENNVQYNDALLKRWPNARILGATATPYRFSGGDLPLGRVLIQMDIGTAVEKGYLVKPIAEPIITNVSLADVKNRAGDFAINELSKVVNIDSRNKLIANKVIELVRDAKRQGILFAVDVAHSKALYELLKNEVRAGQVYGETPVEERRELMQKTRNGEIDVILNNLVCTEGFDVPHLSFAAITRPTRSLGLFIQMAGRALRKAPGKTDCIILDVHDKIKHKQSRVTFADMAVAGDLSGDKKRAKNVLESEIPVEEISLKLKNFPIFINTKDQTRWSSDEDSFSVSAWSLSQDQWIVTWAAEVKEQKTAVKSQWISWKSPKVDEYPIQGRLVRHPIFGQGNVKKVKENKATIAFGWDNEKTLQIDSVEVQQYVKELVPDEFDTKKVEKLFYICMPDIQENGRVVSFVKEGRDLILQNDQRMAKPDVNIFLQSEAMTDDVLHLVRVGSKWKHAPASDKQKEFVANMLKNSKLEFEIDLDQLSKGEASSIIEQGKWQELIKTKFGTDYKENLLGYDITNNDL